MPNLAQYSYFVIIVWYAAVHSCVWKILKNIWRFWSVFALLLCRTGVPKAFYKLTCPYVLLRDGSVAKAATTMDFLGQHTGAPLFYCQTAVYPNPPKSYRRHRKIVVNEASHKPKLPLMYFHRVIVGLGYKIKSTGPTMTMDFFGQRGALHSIPQLWPAQAPQPGVWKYSLFVFSRLWCFRAFFYPYNPYIVTLANYDFALRCNIFVHLHFGAAMQGSKPASCKTGRARYSSQYTFETLHYDYSSLIVTMKWPEVYSDVMYCSCHLFSHNTFIIPYLYN